MAQVHLWAPELSSVGGIQAFSGNFLAALRQVLQDRDLRVVLKNNSPTATNSLDQRPGSFGAWPAGLRSAGFAGACLRQVCADRPRLVIATHVNFAPIAHLARRLVGASYVLVAHGIDVWRLKSPTVRYAMRNADLILAVSRHTRDAVIEQTNVPAAKVQLLPNTFSARHFRPERKPLQLLAKHGLPADTPVILTVCRLADQERYKGYDQIFEALPLMRRAVPQVHYLLVGTGPDRLRIEQRIRSLGLERHVTLVGYVEDAELCAYYNACDLFAMPSKAEGFGIVYLEALACGRPVLAGNRDGARDALIDGELGLLVDADDIEALAEEMVRVLRRTHTHPHIFDPAYLYRRVTEQFGFERFHQTVENHLRPFLRDGSPADHATS